MMTSVREDYIEIVFRAQQGSEAEGMRVTDLAEALGCRLPTVTRTVRSLADEGYLAHESRGLVRLTQKGLDVARDIAHRHDDVVAFLTLVLGLSSEQADADACQIEHGLSPLAAERLHAFLNYVDDLPQRDRQAMKRAVTRGANKETVFPHLIDVKAQGWRK